MSRGANTPWSYGLGLKYREAGAHRAPTVKRPLCTECRGGDHFARHTEIGCLRELPGEGHVCGCRIPQTYVPKEVRR